MSESVDGGRGGGRGSPGRDEACAQLGRGADGLLRLALWCETHGLNAGKLRRLAAAATASRP